VRQLLQLAIVLSLALTTACTKSVDSNPNVINLATVAKIKGMDPALSEDLYSNNEVVRVYEALMQYHPYKRPYVLEPLLAEEMPTVSKDGMTYTFKIRKGVLFHDDAAFPNGKGRELKAKDFEYSLKRLVDPRTKSNGAWILEGRIKGLDEWVAKLKKDDPSSKTNYDEVVEGIKAVDDYTLLITLKQPYPQLLNALAMPYASAVAKEVVDKYGADVINHAVGTGAFIVSSYNPNDQIVYKKNPAYWGKYPSDGPSPEDAGKQLPLVDGVNVRVIIEDQPRWLHFLKGEIDRVTIPKDNFGTAVTVLDPNKPSSVENVVLNKEIAAKGVELYGAVGLDFTYTAFNNESVDIPQFKDKRIRQAISLAVDETDAIKIFYNGAATPAQTPIPPGISGFDASYKNPYRTGDIEKARKLLADAGYPGGKGFPEIPFDISSSTTAKQQAEYLQKQLDKLGLKINVLQNTWPAMLKRIENRQAQLWGIAWGADYPDAENFLQLFYGPNAVPAGTNASYYKNKEYDKLFEKARILQDTPERTEMYKKLARMVAEDCPVIFGVHRISIALRQGWIKNDLLDEFSFNRTKYLRVDLEAKKKYGK
jgi:oligopeptide transport system substrate-binding protein